jgi:hypothetical protein
MTPVWLDHFLADIEKSHPEFEANVPDASRCYKSAILNIFIDAKPLGKNVVW